MRRFRIPEIVLGVLLAVAVFAVGAAIQIVNPKNQDAHSQTSNNAPKSTASGGSIGTDERVAEYTEWLAGATFLLAFSTFGLWLVTWRAGVRHSRDMRDALAHAEKAIATTERAFVYIDEFNVELTTAMDSDEVNYEWIPERYRTDSGIYITRFAAQPRWKNGGNTPTKELTIQVDWRGPRGPIPPEYVYREPPEAFFLGPKAVEPSPYIEMTGAQQDLSVMCSATTFKVRAGRHSNPGSLAKFAAMRRASSFWSPSDAAVFDAALGSGSV